MISGGPQQPYIDDTYIRRLCYELVNRYTLSAIGPHGGCGWCGGLPHSLECLIGRMDSALSIPQKTSVIELAFRAGYDAGRDDGETTYRPTLPTAEIAWARFLQQE